MLSVRCWFPASIGCMTLRTDSSKSQGFVIWIGAVVIICYVAGVAILGGSSIITFMTIVTCRCRVSKCKGKGGVVEGSRFPSRHGSMTSGTGSRKAGRNMIGICSCSISLLMTGIAVFGCRSIITAFMTICTNSGSMSK